MNRCKRRNVKQSISRRIHVWKSQYLESRYLKTSTFERSIFEMTPFLVVLYSLLLTMAMCNFIVQYDQLRDIENKQGKKVQKKKFLEVLFETFTVMFGDNPKYTEVK